MCGIIGVINHRNEELIKKGLKQMKRGEDATKIKKVNNGWFGHNLHAIIGHVEQPITRKGTLTYNGEIYNWKKLGTGRNDAEALLKQLDKHGTKRLNKLDGVYAFAYHDGETITLARDYWGVKPLWYTTEKGLAFASQKNTLEKLGYKKVRELHPRHVLTYNTETNKTTTTYRGLPKIKKHSLNLKTLEKKFTKAVLKRVPEQEFAVLFSAGVDSYLIVQTLLNHGYKFRIITTGLEGSEDLKWVEQTKLPITKKTLTKQKIIRDAEKIVKLINDSNPTKIGVGIITLNATRIKEKVALSGLGADELFQGYQRMTHPNTVDECLTQLLTIYEKSTYRDDVTSMKNNTELRLPYLDKELTQYALRIEDKKNKKPLRQLAERIGIPKKYAWRKKKAAQYGTNVDKTLTKHYKHKARELNKILRKPIMKIASLYSGGKDSTAATLIMKNTGYEISCLITIHTENPHSYMYHAPNTHLTKEQAKLMNIPIISMTTKGEKEKELKQLEQALKKAIKKHEIEGVVCGAIQSNYQRMRVLKISEKLGLKFFAPLWGINQEQYMKWLIKNKWEIWISSTSAEGMKKEWLTHPINEETIEQMKKLKINIAGEGGEYETLVTNCPLFTKPLKIKTRIKKEGVNYYLKAEKIT